MTEAAEAESFRLVNLRIEFEKEAAEKLAESESRITQLEEARERESEMLGMQNTETM